ncbi:hypothetical protein [Paenibacillus sp. SI8]|uniref:AAA family ATPase n=1 Tax=unclassified Paenibacillus TaxID=185978 RepID=UPI003465A351
MRKLVFFVGPAAAGKTSLAKMYAKKSRMAFFDMDTLLRPAAETIMSLSGLDPNDRDSPAYKKYCRDLGYRITMDGALDNLELGTDACVVGPFTKEIADPFWLENELARIGASFADVDVKAVYVYLPDEHAYRLRLIERASVLDAWKLDNWSSFSPSLRRGEITWQLPPSSILYMDNTGLLTEQKLLTLAQFIEGGEQSTG